MTLTVGHQFRRSRPVDLEAVPLGVLLQAHPVVQLLPARGHHLQLLVVPRLLRMAQALLLTARPALLPT